jgi:leader peptidase (prepilin peptidase)/N-methyltransferase
MDGLGLFALLFSPFAGVLAWALVLRHAPPETDARAARFKSVLDVLPVLGWARTLRAPGPETAWRGGVETAAVLIAVWALAVEPAAWVWPTCTLGWLLLAASAIDARARILPDEINLAVGALGLAAAVSLGRAAVIDHAVGAAAGLLAFAAFAALYARLRGRSGLGLGDAKLLGALGAWVGWQGLAGVVVIAAGAGLSFIVSAALARRQAPRADTELRFGPFLALGGWLTWLYGPLWLTGAP